MKIIKTIRPWNNAATIARNNPTQYKKLSRLEKIYIWLGIANQVNGRNEYRCGVTQ